MARGWPIKGDVKFEFLKKTWGEHNRPTNGAFPIPMELKGQASETW
jgi:hypothetical protein